MSSNLGAFPSASVAVKPDPRRPAQLSMVVGDKLRRIDRVAGGHDSMEYNYKLGKLLESTDPDFARMNEDARLEKLRDVSGIYRDASLGEIVDESFVYWAATDLKKGDVVDLETDEAWESGVTILGPARSGGADKRSVEFADGAVDW